MPTSETVVSEGTGIPLVPTFPRNPSTHFLPAYPHIYTQQAVITHPADPIQNQPPRNMEHKDASVTKSDTVYRPRFSSGQRHSLWSLLSIPVSDSVSMGD